MHKRLRRSSALRCAALPAATAVRRFLSESIVHPSLLIPPTSHPQFLISACAAAVAATAAWSLVGGAAQHQQQSPDADAGERLTAALDAEARRTTAAYWGLADDARQQQQQQQQQQAKDQ